MIIDEYKLRPRYGEVDRMGYVYHANYVSYCHQARTELLRKLGISDSVLEDNYIMLPVISFEINYKKPAYYDELLIIKTTINELPEVKFNFIFEVLNDKSQLLSQAKSTVAFVDSKTRYPIVIPEFVEDILKHKLESNTSLSEN